jgi:hypothetical protein
MAKQGSDKRLLSRQTAVMRQRRAAAAVLLSCITVQHVVAFMGQALCGCQQAQCHRKDTYMSLSRKEVLQGAGSAFAALVIGSQQAQAVGFGGGNDVAGQIAHTCKHAHPTAQHSCSCKAFLQAAVIGMLPYSTYAEHC